MKRLLLVALFALAGCHGSAPPRWTHADSERAIREVFAPYGPLLTQQAMNIARCESGLNAYAVNGQYRGLFQLGSNYDHTIRFYGGDVWNPWTSSKVARDSRIQRGNWSAFECRP